ncbi:ABC transporter substrate-binding protein [Pseudonocardia sp. HH130630-07]|uniref:ABC transporter substrate-binding protein n=1 Tax=Pseudonocardia sp. HH130630-07 TaxID=1690815 RepID=UPI0018D4608E|nr:ABC transporter substrate-binding protein [Pseudonocardia sp. HH130630-07]
MCTTDYDDLDAVLSTGCVPVAFGFSPWLVPDLAPWAVTAEPAERLLGPIAGFSLERIAAQRPDLIVGQVDLLDGKYDQLGAIAPTVTVGVRRDGWRSSCALVGRALGREDAAAAAAARTGAVLGRERAALSSLAGTRVVVLYRNGGVNRIDSTFHPPGGGSAEVLGELGLTAVDAGAGPAGALADEELGRLDEADVVIVQDFVAETDDLLRIEVFRRSRPVRDRRVVRLSPVATRASFLPSVLSLPVATAEFAAGVRAALAGRGSLEPVAGR